MKTKSIFVRGGRSLVAATAISISMIGTAWAGQLTLYSSAAPSDPMWGKSVAVAAKLDAGMPAGEAAEPLPDSVRPIGAKGDSALDLPIATTCDFNRTRKGDRQEWQDYATGHADLTFVAALYDVGIGITASGPFLETPSDLDGRTIAVPARLSSLRVMVETMLHDGYGIALDETTLIDLPPGQVQTAAANGEIDTTNWNMIIELFGTTRPMPPMLKGHWLSVDGSQIGRMNAHGDATAGILPVVGSSAEILSCRKALTAWNSTPDEIVLAMLERLETGSSPEKMPRWPGPTSDRLHDGARDFVWREAITHRNHGRED